MGLLTLQTTHEEILALYQEVYQLKRDPGEDPCSEDTVEEIWIEILETLKECLWCRQGPTQSEKPGQRTPRMPAEEDFYMQMQVACKHFDSYQAQQQEFQEEALWVARKVHCWVLATMAMLEGHIKWLNCSVYQE